MTATFYVGRNKIRSCIMLASLGLDEGFGKEKDKKRPRSEWTGEDLCFSRRDGGMKLTRHARVGRAICEDGVDSGHPYRQRAHDEGLNEVPVDLDSRDLCLLVDQGHYSEYGQQTS